MITADVFVSSVKRFQCGVFVKKDFVESTVYEDIIDDSSLFHFTCDFQIFQFEGDAIRASWYKHTAGFSVHFFQLSFNNDKISEWDSVARSKLAQPKS